LSRKIDFHDFLWYKLHLMAGVETPHAVGATNQRVETRFATFRRNTKNLLKGYWNNRGLSEEDRVVHEAVAEKNGLKFDTLEGAYGYNVWVKPKRRLGGIKGFRTAVERTKQVWEAKRLEAEAKTRELAPSY
jgi:hypothetical protein